MTNCVAMSSFVIVLSARIIALAASCFSLVARVDGLPVCSEAVPLTRQLLLFAGVMYNPESHSERTQEWEFLLL